MKILSPINDYNSLDKDVISDPILDKRRRWEDRMTNLKKQVKNQSIGRDRYDIDVVYNQLIRLLFCDAIEQVQPLEKLNFPKCLVYRGSIYSNLHVLQIKQEMSLVSVMREKRVGMMCKIFVATFHDSS